MNDDERWLPIVGYEGIYEISDHGQVRSLARPTYNGIGRPIHTRILTPVLMTRRGYPSVSLYKDGIQKIRRIHQLVLEAFVGPCPPACECLHANDVASDNRLENLHWGSKSENITETVRNGSHRNARKTHCKRQHEFTVENTRLDWEGRRQCRACDRIRATNKRASAA